MGTYVALLRGINVGGHRKVPMKELAALCGTLGWQDVRTYVASGNVVFRSSAKSTEKLRLALEEALAERFGFDVSVVLRTGADIVRVSESNPFGEAAAKLGSEHYVCYLAAKPDPAKLGALVLPESDPTKLVADGTEVYLHTPKGYGNTKFENNFIERKLGVVSTARNWNTAMTLARMVTEAEAS